MLNGYTSGKMSRCFTHTLRGHAHGVPRAVVLGGFEMARRRIELVGRDVIWAFALIQFAGGLERTCCGKTSVATANRSRRAVSEEDV
jgi:hypothetical protein